MTPLTKRKALDTVIRIAVSFFMLSYTDLIATAIVIAYGIWSFYDGITRLDLKDY